MKKIILLMLTIVLVISNLAYANENTSGARIISFATSYEDNFTVCLKSDGTVWASGINNYGQLGDGSNTSKNIMVPVKSTDGILSDVKEIAVGLNHAAALKNDGTVWAWGYNIYGQLGDNTTMNRNIAVQTRGVSGVSQYLTDIVSIASGRHHVLAVKNDGTVYSWGSNEYGQLADVESITKHMRPIQVSGLTDITYIATGQYNSFAINSEGDAWGWGYNRYGALGIGTTELNNYAPILINALSDIKMIKTGAHETLALTNTGNVLSAGRRDYISPVSSQTVLYNTVFAAVSGMDFIEKIECGFFFNMAIKTDGSVYAWGENANGQLGIDSQVMNSTPTLVSGFVDVEGVFLGNNSSIAIKNDGTAFAWGYNSGNFGNGESSVTSLVPAILSLSGEIADNYSNNAEEAYQVEIAERTAGKIDYSGDIDCFSFTTDENTYYSLYVTGGAYAEIYDSSDELVEKTGGKYELLPYETYYVKVTGDIGEYSVKVKYSYNAAASSQMEINCTEGEEVTLFLKGHNVNDFSNKTFIFEFDDSCLEIVDCVGQTYNQDLAIGNVDYSDITILSIDTGEMQFSVDKTIADDKTWSGTLTILKLRAKQTTTTEVTFAQN